jgi:hypothetical protein
MNFFLVIKKKNLLFFSSLAYKLIKNHKNYGGGKQLIKQIKCKE